MKEILIAIIIMSGLAVDLLAQPPAHNNQAPPPSGAHLLKEMDSNKDGKLSKREVTGPLAQDFAKLDRNRDGKLSRQELEQAPPPPPRRGQEGRMRAE